MLKRNDLAKQFELIVQQEIRNHNASILATNQSINEMKSQIEDIKRKFSENFAKQEHGIRKITQEFLLLEKFVEGKDIKLASQMHSLDKNINLYRKDTESKFDTLEANFVEVEDFNEFKLLVQQEMNALKEELNSQREFIHASLFKIYKDMNRIMEDFLKDIENRPNELWDVKKELEGKIASCSIDSQGILKEMKVHKKTVFIMEKKIEDLYDIIKRLKQEKSEVRS